MPFPRTLGYRGSWGIVVLLVLAVVGCGDQEHTAVHAAVRARNQIGSTVAGESAQYAYDGAGNILQINSTTVTRVSIAGFTPSAGAVGDIVTISGAGFSPYVSMNAVQLSGVEAPVLSATSSELTFTVPAGATSGNITVTCGITTATSSSAFTVVTGVVVTDFSPKMGRAGTALTITGFDFDPNPLSNSVVIGAGTGGSITSLNAIVGATASSGKVNVTTPSGTGTSSEDFYLLPGDYWEWDIGFTGRATSGALTTVPPSAPGLAGLVVFDGTMGEFASGVRKQCNLHVLDRNCGLRAERKCYLFQRSDSVQQLQV